MFLDVPLITQDEGSVDCGIAGLAMIFQYYGLDVSYAQLKQEIDTDSVGTYAPQLGKYAIKKGFEVEIITLHPKLFTIKDRGMQKEQVITRIESTLDKAKEQDKKVLSYFLEFMKAGGSIKVKIPLKEDIIDELKEQRPLGALLTSKFLGGVPGFNFHYNIITGIDKTHIHVNDPLQAVGKKKHLIEDFFYGIYASAFGDIDNASLLTFKKV